MEILINVIFTICGIIFGLCFLFLTLVSKLTGLTYSEVSVYINLYLQGGILVISSFVILYNSIIRSIKKLNLKSMVILICSIIYFGIYLLLYYLLFQHYGLDTGKAFNLCQKELWELGSLLPIDITNIKFNGLWVNYYIINILIFIIGFLIILFTNYKINKLVKIKL